jgi:hypothetical protein
VPAGAHLALGRFVLAGDSARVPAHRFDVSDMLTNTFASPRRL